jgi:hypothetical protein
MLLVVVFAFQFGSGFNNAAPRSIRENKQIKRLGKCGNGSINRCAVLGAFGLIFKANNVRTGRVQFHRDLPALKRNIKLADAMFMGIKLAVFFCERWGSNHGCCGK